MEKAFSRVGKWRTQISTSALRTFLSPVQPLQSANNESETQHDAGRQREYCGVAGSDLSADPIVPRSWPSDRAGGSPRSAAAGAAGAGAGVFRLHGCGHGSSGPQRNISIRRTADSWTI